MRIEDDRKKLELFMTRACNGRIESAVRMLLDHTIDESTVQSLGVDGLLEEVRRFADSYEPQLGRKLLLQRGVHPRWPHVSTNDRALYQLQHYDMMEAFRKALQVLVRFGLHVDSKTITPEFATWLSKHRDDLDLHARIMQHIDVASLERTI